MLLADLVGALRNEKILLEMYLEASDRIKELEAQLRASESRSEIRGKVLDELMKDMNLEESDDESDDEPMCMDEAGVPTQFIRRCSICGEEGRNSQTHKEEAIEVNGRLTHHWI